MNPACQITHRQISAGTCPRCKTIVAAAGSVPNSIERVWNCEAMFAALDDPSVEVRSITVMNAHNNGPPADLAIPLLAKALSDTSSEIRSHAARGLSWMGKDMSVDDVRRIEEQIPGSPHELGLRILALSYYFLGERESDSARHSRHQHIFWLITHAPDSEIAGSPESSLHGEDNRQAYETAKDIWLRQIESRPENTTILGNAASFFLIHDSQLSESLLKKACKIERTNPRWSERLGHVYSLQSQRNSPNALLIASSALQAFQDAERMQSDAQPVGDLNAPAELKRIVELITRISKLSNLAKAAFEAREVEVARNYATELLNAAVSEDLPEFFRNDGDAVHQGNRILGTIALQSGDINQARQRLVASACVSGSAVLSSFGPNMSLAKELLERGERDVVLEFFGLCAKFWEHGSSNLAEWSRQVRAGEIPAFGANLNY